MLDLRLYRVTLLPFAIVAIVAAFSLHPRPATPSSGAPAQTFDGGRALSLMNALAVSYPDRSPGSGSDEALASALTRPSPHGLAAAAFRVSVVHSNVETTVGERTVETVIATRAGTGAGIALIADRGSSAQGPASLSGTAALVQLASIYNDLDTARPLTLVSTAGGASAMAALAGELPPGIEAAIVIGDLADTRGGGPYVLPWSSSGGLAPVALRASVEAAVQAALGRPAPGPSVLDQLLRMALPVTTGSQGPLEAAGLPSVQVGADGESAPRTGGSAGDAAQIGAFGEALLAVTTVLDGAPALPAAPTRDLAIGTQVLGGWAARAVIGALLLSLIACSLDVLARARRRRVAVGRWIGWVLSFAVPFALAGLFAAFLGAGGLLPATPAAAVTPAQLPISGEGAAALVSIGLLFVLVWVLRAGALARGGRSGAPEPLGASAALLVVATATALALWLWNPYTAALLILPAHLWLVVLTRRHERSAAIGPLYLALSLVPLAAAVAVVSSGLHAEPLALVWTLVLAVAGGVLSPLGLLFGALTAGCFVAAAAILLRPGAPASDQTVEVITVRGPRTYAGPGSLGGTESALHR